ncbi:hypothetical protein [Actinoplanes sp. NPDC026623]|uniref:hypothetical protein n=1 Tax=Actinoplanes sp. NPDC026623 TaxID=3155610 RepID=UPI0033C84769
MNKATRITVVGLGLLAGATLGMGPAQASSSTGQAAASSSVVSQQGDRYFDDDGVVGYYRGIRPCRGAGFYGERVGAWSNFECQFVRWGIRRGAWALVVDDNYWDNGWEDRWRPGTWPGSWPNDPVWRPNSGDYGGGGGFQQHAPINGH